MSRILVADDDRLIRAILSGALRRAGHEVSEAADGLAALAAARQEQPDCIVLDVMMPKARGIEVCRELRGDGARQPGIVMLSARGLPADRWAAVEAGADAYLTKPVNLAELASVVDRAIGTRTPS